MDGAQSSASAMILRPSAWNVKTAAQVPGQSLPHLLCGLAVVGDDEYLFGERVHVADEVCDLAHDHGGLPGSGSGEYQRRVLVGRYGLGLLVRQPDRKRGVPDARQDVSHVGVVGPSARILEGRAVFQRSQEIQQPCF